MKGTYDKAAASELLQEFGAAPEMLVQILNAFVEKFSYISEEAIRQIADEVNLSRADVHGVVSYYHDHRTKPAGKRLIRICQAEACQAMGSRELTDYARRILTMDLHETENDITLEPIYCLGNCACSPAVMIDGKTYGRVDEARFDALLDNMRETD